MRVLIGVYELENYFGGTQTWTLTMRHALQALGHDVDLYSASENVNELFEALQVHTPNRRTHRRDYDLVVCNSNTVLEHLRGSGDTVMFVSHGVLPQLEQPVSGADLYVAVSEEVAWNIESRGFECSAILRNPIDTERFEFAGCGQEPRHICFLCRRHESLFEQELASMGYEVTHVGRPPVPDIRPGLADADVVVALGRGVYEAMAMGKNVLVSGNNSGRSTDEVMDGLVTNETFYEFRTSNCSGRTRMRIVASAQDLSDELQGYSADQGRRNRDMILENNDSVLIARQLLSLVGQ